MQCNGVGLFYNIMMILPKSSKLAESSLKPVTIKKPKPESAWPGLRCRFIRKLRIAGLTRM